MGSAEHCTPTTRIIAGRSTLYSCALHATSERTKPLYPTDEGAIIARRWTPHALDWPVTDSDRRDYVRAMLERYREAVAQGSLGASLEAHGDRLLMFPREFNQAMRELDRCLGLMRRETPALRWHVIAWYVDI